MTKSSPWAAAISRFAMRVGDRMQEGEVVERRRAQQVYEDFLHRKQDPALLEKDAGNEFDARVFPIEPNAEKVIVIAYSEGQVGWVPYVLERADKLWEERVHEADFGSTLARRQIRVALSAILRRLPDYEVDHSRLVRAETIGVTYGTFAMPITFTPGQRILG